MARPSLLLVLFLSACSAAVQVDVSRLGDAGAVDSSSSDIDAGTTHDDLGSPVDLGMTPVDAGADAHVVIPFDAGPPRDVVCTDASDCRCNTGDRCVFHCPGGHCTVRCRTGSMCDVECAGGDCDVTCEDASTCSVGCGGTGGCTTQCGRAASCNVMCTMDCQLQCSTLLMCAQSCPSSPASCMISG